jgi:hypothetical protein
VTRTRLRATYEARITALTAGLIAVRDHHVKRGPFNTDGTMCTRCLLCGANIDKGERHEDPRFSCTQAESALREAGEPSSATGKVHESPQDLAAPRTETCGTCGGIGMYPSMVQGMCWKCEDCGHPPTPTPTPGPTKGP